MFLSLKSNFITQNVFNRKLVFFSSIKKGILIAAIKLKLETLSEKQNKSILVISALPLAEEFKNNANLCWFKNFESCNIALNSFDFVVIYYENLEETSKQFIIKVLTKNKNVFVVCQNNFEEVLKIFKENGKDFVSFNCGYDEIWRIKSFRKPIIKDHSRVVKSALKKDDSFWIEKDIRYLDYNKLGIKFETFPHPSDEVENDFPEINLDIGNQNQDNSDFDSSINELDKDEDFE